MADSTPSTEPSFSERRIVPAHGAAKIGLPPGSLVYVGAERKQDPEVTLLQYNEKSARYLRNTPIADLKSGADTDFLSWINVDGIHKPEWIGEIGELFEVHPIIQEDIVNTHQRPAFEEMGAYLYVSLKMIYQDSKTEHICIEQVSFLLGKRHLLTFQEQHEDVFQPVRTRLQTAGSRIRKQTTDYLLFALMDTVIDHYFVVLETMEDRIEKLEDLMEIDPNAEVLQNIQIHKKEMVFLRKAIFPLREVLNQLIRSESPLIRAKTKIFFKDLYDKIFQAVETVEIQRDMLNSLQELHLALNGQRMNEIMKVLTIIATIFIPLTFIAGIYGMNFQHMPELAWKWGYAGVWMLMLSMVVGLLFFFRQKKWF